MAVNKLARSWAFTAVGMVAVFVALTFSFLTNGFAVAPWNEWAAWERGSEAMVMKRIEVDLVNRDSSVLGLAAYAGDDFSVYDRLSSEGLLTLESTAPNDFIAYASEVGGQAYFWSVIWRDFGCSSISCLRAVGSALTAASVIAMFFVLSQVGSKGLGWAWLISTGFSPWIAFAARNLFWSPWLYFLPAIAALGVVVARSSRWRWIALGGVFLAFVVKYLGTGYHEFTAFTMLAAAMPIIAIIFRSRFMGNRSYQLANSILILASSALAFALVLSFHAVLLTGSIITGLQRIWSNTIVRRTHGGLGESDPIYSDSLNSSPLDVVWKYVWKDWSTDLLSFSIDRNGSVISISLGSAAFILLIFASCVIVIWRLAVSDQLWRRDATLLAMGFLIPVVWFVSAKGYSYLHTFILFFLWYFLFVPVLLFVVGSFAWGYRYVLGIKAPIPVSSATKSLEGSANNIVRNEANG
jgi:hypothetical protein